MLQLRYITEKIKLTLKLRIEQLARVVGSIIDFFKVSLSIMEGIEADNLRTVRKALEQRRMEVYNRERSDMFESGNVEQEYIQIEDDMVAVEDTGSEGTGRSTQSSTPRSVAHKEPVALESIDGNWVLKTEDFPAEKLETRQRYKSSAERYEKKSDQNNNTRKKIKHRSGAKIRGSTQQTPELVLYTPDGKTALAHTSNTFTSAPGFHIRSGKDPILTKDVHGNTVIITRTPSGDPNKIYVRQRTSPDTSTLSSTKSVRSSDFFSRNPHPSPSPSLSSAYQPPVDHAYSTTPRNFGSSHANKNFAHREPGLRVSSPENSEPNTEPAQPLELVLDSVVYADPDELSSIPPSSPSSRMSAPRYAPNKSNSSGWNSKLYNRKSAHIVSQLHWDSAPRTVVIQKGKGGFGFVLRGAKSQQQHGVSTLDFTPTTDFPALQYLDRVDRGSMADKAGLKPGDFIIEINGENVVNATHERTVQLIKQSGDTLAMKVVTCKPLNRDGFDPHLDGTMTLPLKTKKAPAPPKRNPLTSLTPSGRSQALTVLESLDELEKLDKHLSLYDEGDSIDLNILNATAAQKGIDTTNMTASIRSRQSKRLSTTPLVLEHIDNFDTTTSASNQPRPVIPSMYATPSEPGLQNGARSTSTPRDDGPLEFVDLNESVPPPSQQSVRKPSYSNQFSSSSSQGNASDVASDGIYAVPYKGGRSGHGSVSERRRPGGPPPAPPAIPPPPKHTPPAPPQRDSTTQLVSISTRGDHVYANLAEEDKTSKESPYESSFRPGTNAKLSKDPGMLHQVAASARMTQVAVDQTKLSTKEPVPDYDPEPDYDTVDTVQTTNVKSEPERKVFNNAIVMAAAARKSEPSSTEDKQRVSKVQPQSSPVSKPVESNSKQAQPQRVPISPVSKPVENRNSVTQAQVKVVKTSPVKPAEDKSKSNAQKPVKVQSSPIPKAPPPPPLASQTPPQQRHTAPTEEQTPAAAKKSMPDHIKKQLEADKQREQTHAALLAAVARRRNVVDTADMDVVSNSIENRIEKGKKQQSTIYRSDQTKVEVTPKPMPVKASLLSVDRARTSNQSSPKHEDGVSDGESERSESPGRFGKDSSRGSISSTGSTDFLAMAEKARQQYVQKMQQENGEVAGAKSPPNAPPPPPPSTASPSTPSKMNGTTPVKKTPPPVQPKQVHMGDIAQVIAQKALKRGQSPDNNPSSVHNVNNNAISANSGVTVRGATVGHSVTDPTSPSSSNVDKRKLYGVCGSSGKSSLSPDRASPMSSPASSSTSTSYPAVGKHSSPASLSQTSTENYEPQVAPSFNIEEFVVPPPPVFDEDSLSNTSSLSAISSADLPLVVPPPPPLDSPDDLSFIPPPMEFDAVESPSKGSIESWSVADVSAWLRSLDLGEHCTSFERSAINGLSLLQLGRNDLVALGVVQVHHRTDIERGIRKSMSRK